MSVPLWSVVIVIGIFGWAVIATLTALYYRSIALIEKRYADGLRGCLDRAHDGWRDTIERWRETINLLKVADAIPETSSSRSESVVH